MTPLRWRSTSEGKMATFIQLNAQHARLATVEVCKKLEKCDLALLQEPWIRNDKIMGFTRDHTVLRSEEKDPRTCIVSAKKLTMWLIPHLSSRDCTAALLKEDGGGHLLVVSKYLPHDGNMDRDLDEMEKILDFAKKKKCRTILGLDANAQHLVWGSSQCNKRGEDLFEFILSKRLTILNSGDEPTFVARNRREVLDITLCSNDICESVMNWKVLQEDSKSDHRIITFTSPGIKTLPRALIRDSRKTDWGKYTSELATRIKPLEGREIENIEGLDDLAQELVNATRTAGDIACPPRRSSGKPRKRPWSDDCQRLRRESRRLYRTANREDTDQAWDQYRQKRREYQHMLRYTENDSWKNFCSDMNDLSAIARFSKLNGNAQARLGMLRKESGDYTESPNEVIQVLLDAHFPGNREELDPLVNDIPVDREEESVPPGLITEFKTKAAIQSFSPYKAPGPDGIQPIHLQKGMRILLPTLMTIFKACMKFSYVPQVWRKARVVFLPKPGKVTYQVAKSFRPITLSSFCLKTLERLIDWHLRQQVLVPELNSPAQHAYREGRSTETALHALVAKAEKTLEEGSYMLTAFIDIEGAFNNLTVGAIMDGLQRRNSPKPINKLIEYFLLNRNVVIEHLDTHRISYIHRGTPQGGVLSPLMWNLALDRLLDKLQKEHPEVCIVAYADDLAISISGIDPDTISILMTAVLRTILGWCLENKLDVNPSKTEVMLFTRRRKIIMRPVKLKNEIIPLAKEIKYLGVKLTPTLNWTPHIEERGNKARIILAQCSRLIGKRWGLEPKYMYWVYQAIIRPIISYGAVVWAHATEQANNKKSLGKIQRISLMCITGAMRSTPTAGMEAILGFTPLDIFTRGEAQKAKTRIQANELWTPWWGPRRVATGGHVKWLSKVCKALPILDHTKRNPIWNRRYTVTIPTRKDWEHKEMIPALIKRNIICFTDGSQKDLYTGAGTVIQRPGLEDVTIKTHLGRSTTVFQAELVGIDIAAKELIGAGTKGKYITIFCDNQAVLKALDGSFTNSLLMRECHQTLNRLATCNNDLSIIWIPSHRGIRGNEMADYAAKEAARVRAAGAEPFLPATVNSNKEAVNRYGKTESTRRWRDRDDCRQTRNWCRRPNEGNEVKRMISLSRSNLKLLISIITGHNVLNRHLCMMRIREDGLCGNCGELEDTVHFICKCSEYSGIRREVLGKPVLDVEDLPNIKHDKIIRYAKLSRRFEQSEPEHGD